MTATAGPPADLRAVGARFQLPGTLVDARRYGSGHINDTFAVTYDQAGTRVRYIQQRVNRQVFGDVDRLMDNVARVLAHARQRLGDAPDASRRVLTLVPARDGGPLVRDAHGEAWRTYLFIEGTCTHDVTETPAQAEAAARAFGAFQRLLADLPGARLHETIPRFHHTPDRLAACLAAIDADPYGRAAEARDAIAFVLARADRASQLVDALARGDVPERVTHNDTKINNVLMDAVTGDGLCVIDLDTTMPGLAAYDFGDLVRTATASAAEDERDLSRVQARPAFFDALARGFLAEAGPVLTRAEVETLTVGGPLITLEQGIRFLADHLQGDAYYRVSRPGQNLDRARAQFALVASLEAHEDECTRVIRRYAAG